MRADRRCDTPSRGISASRPRLQPWRIGYSHGDTAETGLQRALEDGSFKALFLSYHREYIDQANLQQRLIFPLDNPFLSPGTPAPDTRWWYPEPP